MPLRIVVWNCARALDRKYERLMALRPDVAIVPECAEPDVLRRKAPGFAFNDCDWAGESPTQGLGVFTFGAHRVRRHESWERRHHIFLPVEVRGAAPVNLLAVWAFNHRVPAAVAPNPGTTLDAIRHYEPFLRSAPSVVAGDFNANVLWDQDGRYARFAEVHAELWSLGMTSAYHHNAQVALGEEPAGTLFFLKKVDRPFHIDYVYVPKQWTETGRLHGVTIGRASEWLRYSDHVPLMVDVEPVEDRPALRGTIAIPALRAEELERLGG